MAKTDQYQVKVPKLKLLAVVYKIILKYILKKYFQGRNPMVHLSIETGQNIIRISFFYFKGKPEVKAGSSSVIPTHCCISSRPRSYQ